MVLYGHDTDLGILLSLDMNMIISYSDDMIHCRWN